MEHEDRAGLQNGCGGTPRPPKIVLVAANAQYMHTNLAVRSVAGYVRQQAGIALQCCEYTINQPVADALEELVALDAQVYVFSVYIWNTRWMLELAGLLRQLLPGVCLAAAGPQVGPVALRFLQRNAAFDVALYGEGEPTCLRWFEEMQKQSRACHVAGMLYRKGKEICDAGDVPPTEFPALPFPYEGEWEAPGRILYYESMRGCPYSCSYCLSGVGDGVRMRPMEDVKAHLLRFYELSEKPQYVATGRPVLVKFVDRTFNCDMARALEVWRWLARHDNGRVVFHFEIAGHLLNEEALCFLAAVRPGLFQFEVGVQSTHEPTLKAIQRPGETAELFDRVRGLRRAGNIHLHLDLIAGLPMEGYGEFAASFNDVYAQAPHQLQLGFLKVLPGSRMEQQAGEYGLVYAAEPPYEVLKTDWLDYAQLCALHHVADMVELYYNSGRFTHMLNELLKDQPSPLAFWQALAEYRRRHRDAAQPLGKTGQYQLLYDFACAQGTAPKDKLQWLCRLDVARHEKPHKLPAFVQVDGSRPYRERALAFYQDEQNLRRFLPGYLGMHPKQILKQAHIEVLPFDAETGEARECAWLFDYRRRTVDGAAVLYKIELPLLP